MKKKSFSEIVNFYQKRFSYHSGIITESIKKNTQTIVVIPCYNEPDLISTLQSLERCDSPKSNTEIIVIINASSDARKYVLLQNATTQLNALEWTKNTNNKKITYHILNIDDLPPKKAGVGLARKIGMDEAIIRFGSIDTDGTIVCLDADCQVSKNYFVALENVFSRSKNNLGHFHYEHLYKKIAESGLKEGIINYELFLRFYEKALKYSGFPFAVQTVGSCMIVRASLYALQGGMNKRKAGEDFYFIHKTIPHSNFVEIKDAKVFPASRVSDRVPFGTGKAQQDWLDGKSKIVKTYNFRIFEDLKVFIIKKDLFFKIESVENFNKIKTQLPISIQCFLEEHDFYKKMQKINSNSKSRNGFIKKFFEWFDGFTILKFVHYAQNNYYKNIPLKEACLQTLKKFEHPNEEEYSEEELLQIFRKI